MSSAVNNNEQFLIKELLEGLDNEEGKFDAIMRKFTYGKDFDSSMDRSPIANRREMKERPPSDSGHDQQQPFQIGQRLVFRSPSAIKLYG